MKVLTGIKPTGKLHLGHYFSCIKPALDLQDKGESVRVLIADLHAYNTLSGSTVYKLTEELEKTLKDFGLTDVYKQSEDADTFCEYFRLMQTATEGELKRCHAYKAHKATKKPINMGLMTYPVLMTADIVVSECDTILVGKDQLQHIEYANDLLNKAKFDLKVKPLVCSQTVIGYDGQKMSKSYGNTLPLDATDEEICKFVSKIKTGSEAINAPKSEENCLTLLNIYGKVNPNQYEVFKTGLLDGHISYKDAKDELSIKLQEFYRREIRK